MSESVEIEYDKSLWGDGPWQNEPDRVQWNHAGFACLMVRNDMGNWCGYVGVPEEHPDFGKPCDDVDVRVHGGLTYSDVCQGHICHVPEPGFPDKVWWLGFDCAHSGDLTPASNALHSLSPTLRRYHLDDTYRDEAWVRSEVEELAEQLAARMGPK